MNDLLEESPEATRRQLVDRLSGRGWITRRQVAAAFAAVPRHLFAPAGTTIEAAYADDTVVPKRGPDGRTTSSISAPWFSLSTLIVLLVGCRGPTASSLIATLSHRRHQSHGRLMEEAYHAAERDWRTSAGLALALPADLSGCFRGASDGVSAVISAVAAGSWCGSSSCLSLGPDR
jgi:hypothetical protein